MLLTKAPTNQIFVREIITETIRIVAALIANVVISFVDNWKERIEGKIFRTGTENTAIATNKVKYRIKNGRNLLI
jgi:hypothetical protein